MTVNVTLLGNLRKYSQGTNVPIIDLPNSTVADLIQVLMIPETEKFVVILNNKRVERTERLKNGDHVVLLPRISGG